MSIEKLSAEIVELKRQLSEEKLKNENLDKTINEKNIRINELLDVNGKLFTQLSFEKPKEQEVEKKKERKIDLSSIDDLKLGGIIKNGI